LIQHTRTVFNKSYRWFVEK